MPIYFFKISMWDHNEGKGESKNQLSTLWVKARKQSRKDSSVTNFVAAREKVFVRGSGLVQQSVSEKDGHQFGKKRDTDMRQPAALQKTHFDASFHRIGQQVQKIA